MKLTKLRIALLALLLAVAAAGVVAWHFLSSLDRLVAETIEREGSAMTGTSVRVSSVSLSLRQGRASIRGLRVANPPGFSSEDAIRFDEIDVTLDIESVTKRPVIVENVVFGSPRILLEVTPAGQSNLDELRRRVEKNSAGPATPDPLRLRILKLTAPGGVVDADLAAVGGKSEELKLDTISRTNVGGKKGATSEEIAKLIVSGVAKETMKAASEAGLTSYLDRALRGERTKVKDRLKDAFK